MTDDRQTVGDVGERGLVDLIRRIASDVGSSVPVGIGDDAAVLSVPEGYDAVVSTDAIPQDLFAWATGLISHYELGQYAARVNISDVVAMGAMPTALFWTLRVESEAALEDILQIARGITDAGREFGVALAGGDSKVAVSLAVSMTACGTVRKGGAVTRTGAAAGDTVYCTGRLGLASAALAYFRLRDERGISLPAAQEAELRDALWRPVPRVGAIHGAGEEPSWTSCIDNTDGVGRSLLELARSSGVKIVVDAGSVPLHPLVDDVGDLLGVDSLSLAFSYGLDLALLGTSPFALPPGSTELVQIGRVEAGHGVAVAGRRRGAPVDIDVEDIVFEHFRAPFNDVIARIATRPQG